ncbi:MAG: hypothetical protein WCI54_12120 [Bacteroidia bacterium]|jgi:hypothetical protein
MGWMNDIGKAISSAVDAVAEVATTIATAIGDFVGDGFETTGNAVQDGLNVIGNRVSGIPGVGGFLKGTFAWMGGIIAGAANLAGGIVKAAFGIVSGALGGSIRIIGGILCLNWSLILKGLIDIGSSIAGGVLVVLGTLLSLIQRIIFCQNNERPLTQMEKVMLRKVFHHSVSLYKIRIIEGWSGLYGITNDGAFTLGNTIYSNQTNLAKEPYTLVHECTHVWQYQNLGPRYTSDALGAQIIYGRNWSRHDAYNWMDEIGRGNSLWKNFNKEAAAQFIQDVWKVGTMSPLLIGFNDGNGTFYEAGEGFASTSVGKFVFEGIDFSKLAIGSVKKLRKAFNIRLSRFIAN